ncbi:MAG: hypothetical protein ACREKE_07280 [bacterium]
MLKKKLDLSTDQVSRWKNADQEKRESAKLLRDKAKADEAQLAVLVDQNASDADLTAALDSLDADHKAMADNGQKFLEKLRHILNPLQQAKAVLLMAGTRGEHGRWGNRSWGLRGGWGGQENRHFCQQGMWTKHCNYASQGRTDSGSN